MGATKIPRLWRLRFGSRQNVGRGNGGAKRTSWNIADFFDAVHATFRARRNFAVFVELDVRCQVVGIVDGFAVCLAVFQSKLIRSGINLAKIIDATIGIPCWAASW